MLKEKKIKIALIISNILMFIIFICGLIYKTKITFGLFWLLVPLSILINLVNINLWTKRGINPDNKSSKIISRSIDDITTISTICYVAVYLLIVFIDVFKEIMTSNIYFIIFFYILTLIYQSIIILAITGANKETKALVEKYKLGK